MEILLVWVFFGSFQVIQICGEIKVAPVQEPSMFRTNGHTELKEHFSVEYKNWKNMYQLMSIRYQILKRILNVKKNFFTSVLYLGM